MIYSCDSFWYQRFMSLDVFGKWYPKTVQCKTNRCGAWFTKCAGQISGLEYAWDFAKFTANAGKNTGPIK